MYWFTTSSERKKGYFQSSQKQFALLSLGTCPTRVCAGSLGKSVIWSSTIWVIYETDGRRTIVGARCLIASPPNMKLIIRVRDDDIFKIRWSHLFLLNAGILCLTPTANTLSWSFRRFIAILLNSLRRSDIKTLPRRTPYMVYDKGELFCNMQWHKRLYHCGGVNLFETLAVPIG